MGVKLSYLGHSVALNGLTARKNKTMSKIIQANKLKTAITTTLKLYGTVGARVHAVVVAALYHAAKHGDCSHLNRVMHGLRPNDQQALKLYVRRTSIQNGIKGAKIGSLTTLETQQAMDEGGFLMFTKGEYAILHGPNTPQTKAYAKLCETRFVAPDGKEDKTVLDRNNFAEVKQLGDKEILKIIKGLAKRVETTDKQTVEISPAVMRLVEDVTKKADAMLQVA